MKEHLISSWLLDYPLVEFYCAYVVRCSAFLPRIAYVGSIMVITSTINGTCMLYSFIVCVAIIYVKDKKKCAPVHICGDSDICQIPDQNGVHKRR